MGRPDIEPAEARLAMYRGPSTETTLLARNALRSEHDPEHDPEHGPPLADSIAMHPVTGAFRDPAHESGFGVHLFRLAFPFHVLLLLLCNSTGVFMLFDVTPEARLLWVIFTAVGLFSLVSRLLLHCMHDSVRAQRLGSWTYTFSK